MASRKNTKAVQPATAAANISLQTVIDATKAGNFVYTSPSFHESLIQSGDVEINPAMTNEAGEVATRATDKAMNMTATQTAPAAATAKPKFEIKTGEIPARVRKASTGLRAGRAPIYPFEQLEINQYFFVPNASEDKPAYKAIASTVAGANARYVEIIPGETRVNRKGKTVDATKQLRKFVAFDTVEADAEGNEVKGAKVFRVPLTNETLQA